MSHASISRRSFLKAAAAAGVLGSPLLSRRTQAAPSDVIRHASFGGGGMAKADLSQIITHPRVKLVCVAEVDSDRAAALKKELPDIRVYSDWRKMLDEEAGNLDTVNVSTPDHMHAPMAMSCLNRGLHVYCQKPLTHDIYESRRLAEVAREKGLVTQMGIQIHSHEAYKTAVAMVQQGTIGKIREIHTWSDKKWSDPAPRPEKSDPVPENLDWNQWLGVCAERPFIGGGYYHPGNWRKRLDFGTGTFGDMGCHILDPVFSALKLTAPVSIRSEGSAPNQWNWSQDAIVKFVFPATEFTAGPTVALTWYDGDRKPPMDVVKQHAGETSLPGQGSLLIGESGSLIIPHIAMPIVLRDAKVAQVDFPQVPGKNHWHEFIDAAAGTDKTSTYFDYAGPLTEAVLLGGIATRYPKTTLEWDAVNLKFTNMPEANAFVRKDYREGWEVEGLS